MKWVPRWLFNLAAGVSLVLLLVSAGLWARSYFVFDGWWRCDGVLRQVAGYNLARIDRVLLRSGKIHWLIEAEGTVRISGRLSESQVDFIYHEYVLTPTYYRRTTTTDEQIMGFGLKTIHGRPSISNVLTGPTAEIHRVWTVPFWFPTLLAGVLPAFWMWRWSRRRRWATPGVCAKCGYDLRATPDRCPECGTVPEAAKGVAG